MASLVPTSSLVPHNPTRTYDGTISTYSTRSLSDTFLGANGVLSRGNQIRPLQFDGNTVGIVQKRRASKWFRSHLGSIHVCRFTRRRAKGLRKHGLRDATATVGFRRTVVVQYLSLAS